jgi:hypothetical protein
MDTDNGYALRKPLAAQRIRTKSRIRNGRIPTDQLWSKIPTGESVIRTGKVDNDGMVSIIWKGTPYKVYDSDLRSAMK